MKSYKFPWLMVYALSAIILSSCNIGATPAPTQDVGAIQTQAFNQVLTQAAAASSPTPLPTNTSTNTPPATATLPQPATFAPIDNGVVTVTPFNFNTPSPVLTLPAAAPTVAGPLSTITTENGCNNGLLMSEGAPLDGATLKAGQAYEKEWEFLNTGSCAWDEGYVFAFLPTYSTAGFKGYDIVFRKTEDYTAPGKGITFIVKLNAPFAPGEYQGSWKLRDDGGNYFGSMVWVKFTVVK
ncbi:MAG: hypothetical protein HY865_08390 [Chloroflexi bacterium]|nr:hypothetical protein [Chloroflexota bacterium]